MSRRVTRAPSRKHFQALVALACLVLGWLFAATPASAREPARLLNQYKHTGWTVDDGAPANITTMAQSSNGYLWLGGADGLFRFDGLSFELVDAQRDLSRSNQVYSLLAASNGDVWA